MTITGGGVVTACALAAERMTRYAPKRHHTQTHGYPVQSL